jgi:PAS domain S-box-containing protein
VESGAARALAEFLARSGEMPHGVFRDLVEALPIAVYTTDADGQLTYFNAAAVKLSGRAPEVGTDRWCITWKNFLPDGVPLAPEECSLAVLVMGGDVGPGLERIAERPDGTRFWFTPCPAAVRDAEGRIVGGINLLVDITDRKNLEIAAAEQFHAIVETAPECVKIVAPDGTLLFMNRAGLAMVDASSADAVVGRNVYDLIAPEYRERFREFNSKICQGGKGSLQFSLVGLGGGRRVVETRAAPFKYFNGAMVHLAITWDIGPERDSQRATLLLRAIVDSSDDAIVSKDLTGIITSWNNSAERIFGYTAAEAVGQPITMLIPEERLNEEPRILDRLRRGERVDHFETVRQRKDGELIDISLTISPVKDSQGNIIGASKIARDITGRKRTEAALQASEENFRQLANAMPQMVWTARPDGFVDYYNERWYDFTGFERNRLGHETWEPILHHDDVQSCREGWASSVASGQSFNSECRFWDRLEERWRWFVVRALPVDDAAGNVAKWFGTCTDIDDQKRTEDDLRRANQDLEQFAFSASHDLQEPLRSVKIYSELLARTCGSEIGEAGQEYLTYLRKGATRMEVLVRDLLSYTQVVKSESVPVRTDAEEVLASSLADLAAVTAESGAQIASGRLPSVCITRAHLQQLFQNLVGNAIKYRSPGRQPVVNIAAERQDGLWVFSVADNGIGIAPEYREKIFGLFKRLHTSDQYSGTGIGLAICRRIVDRYHGSIWVDSEPGEGSTFRFTLPA